MDDLQRIRQITRHYPELQGLRVVPLGLFFLVIALQRLNLLPWIGPEGDLSYTLPMMLLVFGLWFWIGRYYERNFGKVEPLRQDDRYRFWSTVFLVGFVGIIILENVLYRSHLGLPVSLIGLALGGAYLSVGLASQRWYYSLAGAVFLIASFLPWIMGVDLGNRMYGSLGIVHLFLLSGTLLVCGLYDHFRLMRAFTRSQGGLHAGDAG